MASCIFTLSNTILKEAGIELRQF